jgi:RHS repeat-associated protein
MLRILIFLATIATCSASYQVNVITGAFEERETDLFIDRSYTSNERKWIFNQPRLFDKQGDMVEKLPLDNKKIHYKYDDKGRLKKITEKCEGNILAEAKFEYERGVCHVITDGGDEITYTHKGPLIESVTLNGENKANYTYQSGKISIRNDLMIAYYEGKENDVDGTSVHIQNPRDDFRIGRVKTLKEKGKTLAKFFYFPGHTIVYDEKGVKKIYHHDDKENLKEIETFDDLGNLYKKEHLFWQNYFGKPLLRCKAIEDERGNIIFCTTYKYNREGLLEEETLWGNLSGECTSPIILDGDRPTDNGVEKFSTRTFYDGNRVTKVEDDSGYAIHFEYDKKGLLLEKRIEVKSQMKKRERFIYSDDGSLIETLITDENNALKIPFAPPEELPIVHCSSEEPKIEEESTTDCFGRTVESLSIGNAYDCLDRVTETTDANGYTTYFKYNARSQPTEIIHPDGTVEAFFYTLKGNLKRHISRDNRETRFWYDEQNRLVKRVRGQSVETFTFDAFKLLEKKCEKGIVTTYTYDDEMQEILQEKSTGECLETEYDALGNVLCKRRWFGKDKKHLITLYENEEGITIEADGHVLKKELEKDLKSCASRYSKLVPDYEETICGRIIPKEEERWCGYDPNGNKTREENGPYVKEWQWGPNNRLEAFIEAEEKRTSYFYNELGQLSCIEKPDGTCLSTTYDSQGRVIRVVSSDGTVDDTTTYDCRGNNTLKGLREFDERDNLVKETLENGLTVLYTYDEMGRRLSMTLPDHSQVLYTYDALFLRKIERVSAGGKPLYETTYDSFDQKGKVVEATLNGEKIIFDRDDLDRLRGIGIASNDEKITSFDERGNIKTLLRNGSKLEFSYDDNGFLTQDICYDSFGNRLLKGDESYHTNNLFQYILVGGQRLEYDERGNLTKKGSQKYFYDALDRLVRVEIDGTATIEYTYDALSRRLSKTKRDLRTNVETKELYLYEGQKEIGCYNEKGECLEFRLLGLGLQADLMATVAVELKGNLHIPTHDIFGSIVALTDATTGIEKKNTFTAFGEGDCSLCPWGYQSKRHDPDTNLIHFNHRDYDPSLGRFTTKDPLQGIDGANPYTFCQNNPLNNCDPYGLFSMSDFWKGVAETFGHFRNAMQDFKDRYAVENYYQYEIDTSLKFVFGPSFNYLVGYHVDASEYGVYGYGECHDKVRVTLINGMLNDRPFFQTTLEKFCSTHGNNNIHYVYRQTKGWTGDLLDGILAKLGVISPHARNLANQWRKLIHEMGGVEGGGLIIHYAHSLGGTDTALALSLLTPEERKMIRIITIGSPTAIPEDEVESAVNYGSLRDAISMFNLINTIHPILPHSYRVVFLGSYFGIPFVDHLLDMHTYNKLIEELGEDFVNAYGNGSL